MCLYCGISLFWFIQVSYISTSPSYPSLSALKKSGIYIHIFVFILTSGKQMKELIPASLLNDTILKRNKLIKRHQKKNGKGETQISSFLNSSNSSNPKKIPFRFYLILFLLFVYALSGLSTTLLRVYQYGAHYYFYKKEVEDLFSIRNNSELK